MKPLEGIKVVELSTMLAGPMTARILAEWGADVIKVESTNGDAWREQAGTSLSPKTDIANPNFDMQNLNKRFLSINTRTVDGKQALMKLLETADVFLTNYRVQALEKMGLTYDQLKGASRSSSTLPSSDTARKVRKKTVPAMITPLSAQEPVFWQIWPRQEVHR